MSAAWRRGRSAGGSASTHTGGADWAGPAESSSAAHDLDGAACRDQPRRHPQRVSRGPRAACARRTARSAGRASRLRSHPCGAPTRTRSTCGSRRRAPPRPSPRAAPRERPAAVLASARTRAIRCGGNGHHSKVPRRPDSPAGKGDTATKKAAAPVSGEPPPQGVSKLHSPSRSRLPAGAECSAPTDTLRGCP